MASTDFWLKPLDLQTLSDAEFKKAYAELAAEFKAEPSSEAIKLWVAAYKRESLRRKIHLSQERIRELEAALCESNPYYIVERLDEDLGGELIHLLGLFSDLEAYGPETAEGAESPELQTKRLELIKVETKCIDTRLNLRWRGNTDAVNDHHHKRLVKYRTQVTTLIAELKAML
jgi:hypothetical protein